MESTSGIEKEDAVVLSSTFLVWEREKRGGGICRLKKEGP